MNTKIFVAAALVLAGICLLAFSFVTPGQPFMLFGLSTESHLWRPIEGVLVLVIGIVLLVTGHPEAAGTTNHVP